MRGVPFLLIIAIGLSPAVHAQSMPDSGKGLIWYEGLTGTSSSLGTVSRFDSTLGYNLNHHFSVDFGAPILFVIDLGVADTVPDSTYFVRPYTTLGVTGHFDGGASIRILPLLNFCASAYAIEPSGQQKLFSRFLNSQMGSGGNPGASHSGRVFQTTPETIGSADIARDHGFSLGFDSSPFHLVDLAVGYTHSASFSLDTVYFGLGVNLARFFGSSSH
jgi:hypothetical protein